MKIHPVVNHQNGIVSVTMQAQFIGDMTDASDKQRIQAYGDPQVNLAGQITDSAQTNFVITFPTSELYAGATTQMATYTARFMTALPPAVLPGQPAPTQGPLDCITTDPVHAASLWAATVETRVHDAMVTLRAISPAQLSSLPDGTA